MSTLTGCRPSDSHHVEDLQFVHASGGISPRLREGSRQAPVAIEREQPQGRERPIIRPRLR